jgi:hypothetical protein
VNIFTDSPANKTLKLVFDSDIKNYNNFLR